VAKNIIILADGTGNEGGLLPDESRTNVYKLYTATRTGPRYDHRPFAADGVLSSWDRNTSTFSQFGVGKIQRRDPTVCRLGPDQENYRLLCVDHRRLATRVA
jgi:hypothetical protein